MKLGDGTDGSYRVIFEDTDCDDSYFDDSYFDDSYVDGFTWSVSDPDIPDLPFFAFSAAWRLFSFALLFWNHQFYPRVAATHAITTKKWRKLTWNQIFTWFCVMFRVIAISALSAIERYFFSLNLICNWFIWYSLRRVFKIEGALEQKAESQSEMEFTIENPPERGPMIWFPSASSFQVKNQKK